MPTDAHIFGPILAHAMAFVAGAAPTEQFVRTVYHIELASLEENVKCI